MVGPFFEGNIMALVIAKCRIDYIKVFKCNKFMRAMLKL